MAKFKYYMPPCRKKINRIGYIASKEKNGTIFINTTDLKIDENIINPGKKTDSIFCVLCKKTEPINQLLLCQSCKFNLVHIGCAKIALVDLKNY